MCDRCTEVLFETAVVFLVRRFEKRFGATRIEVVYGATIVSPFEQEYSTTDQVFAMRRPFDTLVCDAIGKQCYRADDWIPAIVAVENSVFWIGTNDNESGDDVFIV